MEPSTGWGRTLGNKPAAAAPLPLEPVNWDAWRRDVFGDPYIVWHDGPGFETLLERWAENPLYVRRMLVAGLAENDPLAAQTLTVLAYKHQSLDGLEALLRKCLPTARDTFRIRVAEALFALTADESLAQTVCDVLVKRQFLWKASWGDRMDAAIALRGFPATPAVIAALLRGVRDRDYLVRSHSADSLLIRAGKSTSGEEADRISRLLQRDHRRASWRRAAKQLQDMVQNTGNPATQPPQG